MKHKVKKTGTIELSWEGLMGAVKNIPDDYQSAQEIADETGLSGTTVRNKLASKVKDGSILTLRKGNTVYYKIKK